MCSRDRKLIDAHLNGDAQAFEAIVRVHGPGVLGYLKKMTGSVDKSEDLFQVTFQNTSWDIGNSKDADKYYEKIDMDTVKYTIELEP